MKSKDMVPESRFLCLNAQFMSYTNGFSSAGQVVERKNQRAINAIIARIVGHRTKAVAIIVAAQLEEWAEGRIKWA